MPPGGRLFPTLRHSSSSSRRLMLLADGGACCPLRVCLVCTSACPHHPAANLLDSLKTLELFLDMVTSAFLAMATFVSHKMIVEKMQMKAEKGSISAKGRKGAIKGGGDSDSDGSDDEGDDAAVPDAVPIEKPKVAKAAASMRRRHA